MRQFELDTIYNEDCLNLKDFPSNSIPICLTDPPYNLGKDYGEDFNDSRPEDEYWDWLDDRLSEIIRVLTDPGMLILSHTDQGIFNLKPILEEKGLRFIQLLYWVGKNGFGVNNTHKWSFRVEPLMVFIKGESYELKHDNPFLWYCSYFEVGRPQSNFKEGRFHVAQKPVKLFKMILERIPGDTVIDPFMGSGTTALACRSLGKHYIGFEINPDYVQIANDRLAKVPLRLDHFLDLEEGIEKVTEREGEG